MNQDALTHSKLIEAEAPRPSAAPTLGVTARAARRIVALLAAENAGSGTAFRVHVRGGGCSGFKYGFAMDAAVNADDTVIERDGARVVVDACSLDLLAGSELDWVESLAGASFQLKNPNAASSCGCGSSFSV